MNIVGITGHTGSGKDVIASRLVEKHGYKQVSLADPLKRFGLNVFGFDVIQLWGSAKNTFDPLYNECNLRSAGVNFVPGCKLASVKRACDQSWGDAAVRLTAYGPKWVADLVPVGQQKQALEDLYFWFASLGHHYPQLSPRIMLQHLGTEWGRQTISEDIWINKMLSTADRILGGYPYDRETGLDSRRRLGRPPGVVISDIRFANEIKRMHDVGGKVLRVVREEADRKAKSVGISEHPSEMAMTSLPDDTFDCILQNNGSIGDLNKAVDIAATTF